MRPQPSHHLLLLPFQSAAIFAPTIVSARPICILIVLFETAPWK